MLSSSFLSLFSITVLLLVRGAVAATPTSESLIPVPTELQGVKQCIVDCIVSAATVDQCGSFNNGTCICTDPQLMTDAATCLGTHCSPQDFSNALQLFDQVCQEFGLFPSQTATTTNSIPFPTQDEDGPLAPSLPFTDSGVGASVTGTPGAAVPTVVSPGPSTAALPTASSGSAAAQPTKSTSGAHDVYGRRGTAALIGVVITVALSL